VTNKNLLGFQ